MQASWLLKLRKGTVDLELNRAEEFSGNESPHSSALDYVQGLWVEKSGVSLSVEGTVLRGALSAERVAGLGRGMER